MEIEQIGEFLEDLDEKDGVLVVLVKYQNGVKILVPQLGLMSESHIEQQIPFIYRSISAERYRIRNMEENERNQARAEAELTASLLRKGAGVGEESEGVDPGPVGPHGKSGESAAKPPATPTRAGAAKNNPD